MECIMIKDTLFYKWETVVGLKSELILLKWTCMSFRQVKGVFTPKYAILNFRSRRKIFPMNLKTRNLVQFL